MKLSSLEAIAKALQQAQARHLIVGGLAVAAHGHGRATFDIDLVLQLQPDNVKRAIVALSGLGYGPTVPVAAMDFADPVLRNSWIRDKGMVVFQLRSDLHPETCIDLFVEEPFDFDREYANALVGEIAEGITVRFIGLPALIEMKRRAGRVKDLEDIRQLQLLYDESELND